MLLRLVLDGFGRLVLDNLGPVATGYCLLQAVSKVTTLHRKGGDGELRPAFPG